MWQDWDKPALWALPVLPAWPTASPCHSLEDDRNTHCVSWGSHMPASPPAPLFFWRCREAGCQAGTLVHDEHTCLAPCLDRLRSGGVTGRHRKCYLDTGGTGSGPASCVEPLAHEPCVLCLHSSFQGSPAPAGWQGWCCPMGGGGLSTGLVRPGGHHTPGGALAT